MINKKLLNIYLQYFSYNMGKKHSKRMLENKSYFAKAMNITDKQELEAKYKHHITWYEVGYVGSITVKNALGYNYNGSSTSLTVIDDYYCVFKRIVKIIENEYNLKHIKGGRKPKMTFESMLKATIKYLYYPNQYYKQTYKSLAKNYGIHESNMYDTVNWVKSVLIKKNIIIEKDYQDYSINNKVIKKWITLEKENLKKIIKYLKKLDSELDNLDSETFFEIYLNHINKDVKR